MEEIEVSVEDQQEAINHHAEHGKESWLLYCALISAVLAVAAATCGLYASHYANEAMLEQMKATDNWGYYQAKGIKAELAKMHSDLLEASKRQAPAELKDNLARYKKEQDDSHDKATEESKQSEYFMQQHETLAKSVTAFQIAIAITAMSAITRRKHFLYMTLALVAGGLYFATLAFLN